MKYILGFILALMFSLTLFSAIPQKNIIEYHSTINSVLLQKQK